MGLTGELVRSVFSKNRSVGSHSNNVKTYGVDKRRWSSVRSYLCGDEFNSVLAEDDSASLRSSEATVTQPLADDMKDENSEATVTQPVADDMKDELEFQGEKEENAAIRIQSAFRRFLARRRDGGIKEMGESENVQGLKTPSRESVGTSIEVQTGGSVEVTTIQEERVAAQHRMHQKTRTQVLKLKEDWDDSTVSSNISKLRIQNRLEATTRRERALAYAFSQQLRICSKKKPTLSEESNMGWTWLERWMATRLPENSLVEDRMSKQLEPISSDRRPIFIKKSFDLAGEEKESCGSNEVSVGIDAVTAVNVKDSHKPGKNRLKVTRTVSRRKTVPSYQCPTQPTKVSMKDFSSEAEKDRKQKKMQRSRSTGEIKYKDAWSQAPFVPETSNNSKWGI